MQRIMALITLTTDFGLRDPYVGMMKGVILRHARDVRLIDLTHDIPAQRPEIAGFWLQRSLPWFPPETVHVAVVDPGVGSARRILALRTSQWLALAPDNGLLGPLLRHPGAELRALDLESLSAVLPARRSRSFHGRDVFAPIAARLATGELDFDALGPTVDDPVPGPLLEAHRAGDGSIDGRVVLADHFGNLITNVEATQLPLHADRVRLGRFEIPLAQCYADVPVGDALALINAHDLLEIAVHGGRACDRFEAGPGTPVHVPARPSSDRQTRLAE